jgi:hypothetical protein
VAAAEEALVQSALEVDPSRLQQVAQDVCHLLDPAGALDAAGRLFARRRVRLHAGRDGGFVLDGVLAPEGGALLSTALNALMMPVRGDTRTTAQRRADALEELARRQLQGGSLPQVAGQRPHLTLTVSAAALRGGTGSAGALHDDSGAGVARLGWAGAVPIESARRLACDAAVSTVTVDAMGTPLDVGRTRRTIPSALRRALVVRDRAAASRSATGRRSGPTVTTFVRGQRAARPVWTTWCCCVSAATPGCTSAAGDCAGTRTGT